MTCGSLTCCADTCGAPLRMPSFAKMVSRPARPAGSLITPLWSTEGSEISTTLPGGTTLHDTVQHSTARNRGSRPGPSALCTVQDHVKPQTLRRSQCAVGHRCSPVKTRLLQLPVTWAAAPRLMTGAPEHEPPKSMHVCGCQQLHNTCTATWHGAPSNVLCYPALTCCTGAGAGWALHHPHCP